MSEIANKIRKLRKDHGLTQEGLAERVRISRETLACIETDRRTISIPNCCRIAEAFPGESARDWAYAAARDGVERYRTR